MHWGGCSQCLAANTHRGPLSPGQPLPPILAAVTPGPSPQSHVIDPSLNLPLHFRPDSCLLTGQKVSLPPTPRCLARGSRPSVPSPTRLLFCGFLGGARASALVAQGRGAVTLAVGQSRVPHPPWTSTSSLPVPRLRSVCRPHGSPAVPDQRPRSPSSPPLSCCPVFFRLPFSLLKSSHG